MMEDDKKPERDDRRPQRPAERKADEAKPLAEEIEEEMLDQDIPVETGIRPGDETPEK